LHCHAEALPVPETAARSSTQGRGCRNALVWLKMFAIGGCEW
jgi:hypothetical protein